MERLGGLQTQYSPSAYVGLWSRLAGFRREHLTGALLDRRIVQAWVMRCTIHMVSAADYPQLTEAVREQRRLWWTRGFRDLADVDMTAVAATVRELLAAGPRKQAEIVAHLVAEGFPKAAFPGAQLWVDLVRVPPAGTWDLPRAPLPDADTPAPVRFLSNYDAVLLLGHATRARLLPPEHRDKVFHTRMPQSTPTFLVDGRVAGTWRFTGDRVQTTPFEPLPPAARDEVTTEAARLTAFHREG